LQYLVIYITPVSLLFGAWLGGGWTFFPAVLMFILVPFFDIVLGRDSSAPEESPSVWIYEAVLLGWLPVQLACIAAVAVVIQDATWVEVIGLTLSTGLLTGGGGITVAHELMHRTDSLRKAAAEILMTAVSYPHFCVEHVLGHHKNVATPADPATSRLGESAYAFLPRTLFGGVRSAWRLETRRVERNPEVRAFSLSDRRLRYPVVLLAVWSALLVVGGPLTLAFFVAQGAVGVLLLEVINYVEHYGLQRQEISPGRFERIHPHHSWNSTQRLTNLWTFNLQRHADHHAYASRPYYQLRAWGNSPMLPAGYPTMILVALVPPLWRRVMDDRVVAARKVQIPLK